MVPPPPDFTTVPEGEDALGMPKIMNLYESGLCRSPRIVAKRTILANICF